RVTGPVVRTADDVGERPPVVHLLPVHEQAGGGRVEAGAGGRGVEGGRVGPGGGAAAGGVQSGAGGREEGGPVKPRNDPVASAENGEVGFADHQPIDIGTVRVGPERGVVGVADSLGGKELVVHQDGEGAVAVIERPEAVRDAGHLVGAD